MRVIAGSAKGRRLFAPKGVGTRPTADRVKESLFNIIADRIEGASVLDLYAGSGSLPIEALSRGAASALIVESDKAAAALIYRNLELTSLTEHALVWRSSAGRALGKLTGTDRAFDLIFLDPPYRIETAELEIVLRKAAGLLKESGLIVLEHRPDLPELKLDGDLFLFDKRRYGGPCLSFYKKRKS